MKEKEGGRGKKVVQEPFDHSENFIFPWVLQATDNASVQGDILRDGPRAHVSAWRMQRREGRSALDQLWEGEMRPGWIRAALQLVPGTWPGQRLHIWIGQRGCSVLVCEGESGGEREEGKGRTSKSGAMDPSRRVGMVRACELGWLRRAGVV